MAVLFGLTIASLRTVVIFVAVFVVKGILRALAILPLAAISFLVAIRLSALVGIVVVVFSVRSIIALLAVSISAAMNVTMMAKGVIVRAIFTMGVHFA